MNNILSKSLENRYSKTKRILNNAQASFKESRGIMRSRFYKATE